MLREIWRQARLLRYGKDVRGLRTKHRETLAERRRLKGAKPRRQKLGNSSLSPARSTAEEPKEDVDKSPT